MNRASLLWVPAHAGIFFIFFNDLADLLAKRSGYSSRRSRVHPPKTLQYLIISQKKRSTGISSSEKTDTTSLQKKDMTRVVRRSFRNLGI